MEKNWKKYWFGFIKKNKDKPWDWDTISKNPNLTMEIIDYFPDKNWNWDYINWNKI